MLYAGYLNCDGQIIESFDETKTGGSKIKQRGFSEPMKKKNNINNSDMKINDLNTDDVSKPKNFGGSYCKDLYEYLTQNTKRYFDVNILQAELQPKFSYHDLDLLKITNPLTILLKTDRDELYQLYDKLYPKTKQNTIADFYKWLKENKCYLLDQFVGKIDRLLGKNNPFRNDVYILDPATYLYNRKHIKTYPIYGNLNVNIKRNVLNENKNDYRI